MRTSTSCSSRHSRNGLGHLTEPRSPKVEPARSDKAPFNLAKVGSGPARKSRSLHRRKPDPVFIKEIARDLGLTVSSVDKRHRRGAGRGRNRGRRNLRPDFPTGRGERRQRSPAPPRRAMGKTAGDLGSATLLQLLRSTAPRTRVPILQSTTRVRSHQGSLRRSRSGTPRRRHRPPGTWTTSAAMDGNRGSSCLSVVLSTQRVLARGERRPTSP